MPVIVATPYFIQSLPSQGFIRNFTGFPYAFDYATAVDNSGNVYTAGYADSIYYEKSIPILTKSDSTGNVVWMKSIGTPTSYKDETLQGIAVDGSNVYVVGATLVSGNADGLIMKYDTNGNPIWQKTIAGSGNDRLYGVDVDTSGNLFISGLTASEGQGSNDNIVIKMDSSGNVLWQQTIGQTSSEFSLGVTVSGTDAFIIGYTASEGQGSNDIFIAKLNSGGTVVWQKTIGGTASDLGYNIAVDGSGNLHIVGYSGSDGAGSNDFFVAKLNSTGDITWQRTIGGIGSDLARVIDVDSSNNVYVVGYSPELNSTNDFVAIKLDSSGNLLWQKYISSSESDTLYGGTVHQSFLYLCGRSATHTSVTIKIPTDGPTDGTYGDYTIGTSSLTIAPSTLVAATSTLVATTSTLTLSTVTLTTADVEQNPSTVWGKYITRPSTINADIGKIIHHDSLGNLYAVTRSTAETQGSNDIALTKFDSSGNNLWQRHLGGAASDNAQGIYVHSTGVAIAGRDATTNDAVIIKYSTSGTLQWQRTLGGASADYGYGTVIDSGGNVYVCGHTQSLGNGNELFIAKYNTSGTLQWQIVVSGAGSEQGTSMTIDSSNNLYVVGLTSTQGEGGSDALIVKVNSSGTVQWQKTLGGTGTDSTYMGGIAWDSVNNAIYVSMTQNSDGQGNNDAFLARFDVNGNLIWQKGIGTAGADYCRTVDTDSSGNVLLLAMMSSSEAILVKFTSDGSPVFQKILASNNPYSLDVHGTDASIIFSTGNIITIGTTAPPSNFIETSFTIYTPTLVAATSTLAVSPSTLTSSTSTLVETVATDNDTVVDIKFGLDVSLTAV